MLRRLRTAVDSLGLITIGAVMSGGSQRGLATGTKIAVTVAAQRTVGMTATARGILQLIADMVGHEMGTMGSVATTTEDRQRVIRTHSDAERMLCGQGLSGAMIALMIDGMANGPQGPAMAPMTGAARRTYTCDFGQNPLSMCAAEAIGANVLLMSSLG